MGGCVIGISLDSRRETRIKIRSIGVELNVFLMRDLGDSSAILANQLARKLGTICTRIWETKDMHNFHSSAMLDVS